MIVQHPLGLDHRFVAMIHRRREAAVEALLTAWRVDQQRSRGGDHDRRSLQAFGHTQAQIVPGHYAASRQHRPQCRLGGRATFCGYFFNPEQETTEGRTHDFDRSQATIEPFTNV